MSIIELLSQRIKQLRETEAKLELSLEPLEATKEEIALIERMMGLADFNGERSSEPSTAEPVEDTQQSTNDKLYEALQGLILPTD